MNDVIRVMKVPEPPFILELPEIHSPPNTGVIKRPFSYSISFFTTSRNVLSHFSIFTFFDSRGGLCPSKIVFNPFSIAVSS